jgi:hypothetical protein
VITELQLPLIDGVALCHILRKDRMTAEVPILVVTGESRPDKLERVVRAGANAVLAKPTASAHVVSEANRLLSRSSALQQPSAVIRGRIAGQLQKSEELLARSAEQRRTVLAKAHQRFTTTTPPAPPPALVCPSCDHPLEYQQSHIGGVSAKHPEQWDYYVCPGGCGMFQYRQRTKKIRRVT